MKQKIASAFAVLVAMGLSQAHAETIQFLEKNPIIAHRGASGIAPESTRASHLIARELGARYLECDVHRTRDNFLVVSHDDDMLRTSNFREVFGNKKSAMIKDLTLDELRQLDMSSWFKYLPQSEKQKAHKAPLQKNPHWRESFAGQKILTLGELIEIADGAPKRSPLVGLYIETKSPGLYPNIEKQIVAELIAHGWLGSREPSSRVVFQSFDLESLKRFKRIVPNVPRIYLTAWWGLSIKKEYQAINNARNVAYIIGPVAYGAMPLHNKIAHLKGLLVQPYVLDTDWQMDLGYLFGADGFFTDRCDLAFIKQHRIQQSDVESALKAWDQGTLR